MSESDRSQPVSDIELAVWLASHIMDPCHDEQGNSVRPVYEREAQRLLDKNLHDPVARKILEQAINSPKD